MVARLDFLKCLVVVQFSSVPHQVEIRQLFSDDGLRESNSYYLLDSGTEFTWESKFFTQSSEGSRTVRRVENGVLFGLDCTTSLNLPAGTYLATEGKEFERVVVSNREVTISIRTNLVGSLALFEHFRRRETISTRRHRIQGSELDELANSVQITPGSLIGVVSGKHVGALKVKTVRDNQIEGTLAICDCVFGNELQLDTLAVFQNEIIVRPFGVVRFVD